jgi:membrane protease YdiL (CAAX protease family)
MGGPAVFAVLRAVHKEQQMRPDLRRAIRRGAEIFLIAGDGRPGLCFRIGLYLFAFLIVIGLSQGMLAGFSGAADPLPEAAQGAAYFAAAVGGLLPATALARRFLDRRPWRGIGWTNARGGIPRMLSGWTAGCALIGVLFGIEYALGWVRIEGYGLAGLGLISILDWIAGTVLIALAVGITEETAFRGYVFRNLGEDLPLWAAIPVTGCLFARMHGSAGWGYFLGVVLISTFFIFVRIGSGSLWFAAGFHAAWNWMQSKVCGLGLGGRPEAVSVLRLRESGPALFIGRGTAIEGGLIAIAVVAAAALCAWAYARRRRPGWAWNTAWDGMGEPAPAARPRNLSARPD